MKRGVCNKYITVWLLTNYLSIPFVGWHIWGFPTMMLGFILAFLIEGFFPKWAYELTWADIDRAIENIYYFGCSSSNICFLVGKRKIYVHRDELGHPIKMGLIIPLSDWSDIWDEEKMNKEVPGISWYGNKWKRKECIFYTPINGRDNSRFVLQKLIEQAEGHLHPGILARVDCAKKDIWKEHEKPGQEWLDKKNEEVRKKNKEEWEKTKDKERVKDRWGTLITK